MSCKLLLKEKINKFLMIVTSKIKKTILINFPIKICKKNLLLHLFRRLRIIIRINNFKNQSLLIVLKKINFCNKKIKIF